MSRVYKGFAITGVANQTIYDDGIGSTETEDRHLVEVLLFVTGQAGNVINGYDGNEIIIENLYDYHVDTDESSGSANVQKSVDKLNRIQLDRDLRQSDKFKIALTCGATNKNLYGCYVYEPTTT